MGQAESKTCGVDPLLFTLCPETVCDLIRVGSASTEPFLEHHAVTPEQRAAHSRRRFSSPGLTATEYAPAVDGNATEYAPAADANVTDHTTVSEEEVAAGCSSSGAGTIWIPTTAATTQYNCPRISTSP